MSARDASSRGSAPRLRVWAVGAVLVLATFAVYLNGLGGAFVFDDIPSIPENPTIRTLWPLRGPLSPPGNGETVSGRPVLNLSFALNHALSGNSPAAFRLTNIAIHAANGLLLLGLVRRTLLRSGAVGGRKFSGASAMMLGSVAALLWLLHPLQTAAVTYVVQRAESLMAFFYLLTLYAFVRGVESARAIGWFVLCVIACALGMATKEVMVSAPLMVRLYDRMLVERAGNSAMRRRWLYAALASTWLLLGWLVIGAGLNRGGSSAFGHGVTAPEYWATQFHAVVKYLGLAAWPNPLVFDYGAEWTRGAMQVAPYALVVIGIIAAVAIAWRKKSPWAWWGIWFFAILAPTSFVPGARQTLAEHRMYLALAPAIIAAVVGLYWVVGRRLTPTLGMAAVALGAIVAARNVDYRALLTIWGDTVAKRPENRWARTNFGNALAESGQPEEALKHYAVALRLEPADPLTHYDAGTALIQLNRLPEAIEHLAEALRLDPDYASARNNLADALYRAGRFDAAVREYRTLLRRGEETPEIRYNLGNALHRAGHTREAIAELTTALQQRPDYAEASYNLGCIFLETGAMNEAVRWFEQTLRLRPDDSEAHNNLASALAQLGQVDDAVRHAREAVRLNPRNVPARGNLASLYEYLGWRAEAVAELREALKIEPENQAVREMLERLRR